MVSVLLVYKVDINHLLLTQWDLAHVRFVQMADTNHWLERANVLHGKIVEKERGVYVAVETQAVIFYVKYARTEKKNGTALTM